MGLPLANRPAGELHVAYVEFFVEDVAASSAHWVERFGFESTGFAGSSEQGFRSVSLRQGNTQLIFTEATSDAHPAKQFVLRHGDGVADIALYTAAPGETWALALAGGAHQEASAASFRSPLAQVLCVTGFGDVVHTLVPFPSGTAQDLPAGFEPAPHTSTTPGTARPVGLMDVDHFAVCVDIDELEPTVARYGSALGLETIFEEHIVVGSQAMLSKVVQAPGGGVTLTILQPDPSAEPGQINEFIANHDGSGIQHVAFTTDDVVQSVGNLGERGTEFLTTPGTYYNLLAQRLTLSSHTVPEIRDLNVLVDEDHGGQLFQIFTRSTHPRRTLFFEIIERLGAKTFGSSNIKALYEAVELERAQGIGV